MFEIVIGALSLLLLTLSITSSYIIDLRDRVKAKIVYIVYVN